MARFVVGDVVAVNFPFSDLRGQKRRPALVVAVAEFGDLILCQITSKSYSSKRAIPLRAAQFSAGRLPVQSYLRPDKLFTADAQIIDRRVGTLTESARRTAVLAVRAVFSLTRTKATNA